MSVLLVILETPGLAFSTGRFQNITRGSFRMIATTEPFVLQPDGNIPYPAPFNFGSKFQEKLFSNNLRQ